MKNVTGSGQATSAVGATAATEATRAALGQLGGAQPSFGFVFASPSFPLADCLRAARAAANGAEIAGCTTAGEFTERGLIHGGVAVFLVASEAQHHATMASGLAQTPDRVAGELCHDFGAHFQAARSKGLFCSTTVALVDGLSGAGERFVESIVDNTMALHQVVGGAAGDEGKFKATQVGRAGEAASDAATTLHVFSNAPWGIGIGHGLGSTTARMRVTRAAGNVVYEIEGRPAFDVYLDHARERGVKLEPKAAGEYLINNELGILAGGNVSRARAPLSVGKDGSLTCAAEVPMGSFVCILDSKPDAMVEAASAAAQEAVANLQGRKPAGVLLFDCICRGFILKDQFQREIDAVRTAAGGVPVAGFLTYGEIASYSGRVESWHNATAVALAIPE